MIRREERAARHATPEAAHAAPAASGISRRGARTRRRVRGRGHGPPRLCDEAPPASPPACARRLRRRHPRVESPPSSTRRVAAIGPDQRTTRDGRRSHVGRTCGERPHHEFYSAQRWRTASTSNARAGTGRDGTNPMYRATPASQQRTKGEDEHVLILAFLNESSDELASGRPEEPFGSWITRTHEGDGGAGTQEVHRGATVRRATAPQPVRRHDSRHTHDSTCHFDIGFGRLDFLCNAIRRVARPRRRSDRTPRWPRTHPMRSLAALAIRPERRARSPAVLAPQNAHP